VSAGDFTEEQKLYLEGLGRGLAAARAGENPGRKAEAKHPLDLWDEIAANAEKAQFPKGTDVFRYKFHGLFYVAPAQNSYMLRLRIPNGILDSYKLRAVAGIAEDLGGGYAHVTTRANLQIREIGAQSPRKVLERLANAGLTSRGAGADNIRNITGNPTAGIDPSELYDTRPLGLELYHAILNHRELYGLPRKFNIAFDGGGRVASLEDTNDIGFRAVVFNKQILFRVAVGGITGHGDFAADLGVAIPPERCLAVALAIVRTFIDEGDRTDRKKARLKYVLDRMGRERFLAAVEQKLPSPLPRIAEADCEPRAALARGAHVGFHAQKQPGLVYCGVVLPLGKMTGAQMRGLADVAERFGSGTLRLTVWQNVLISDIEEADRPAVETALKDVGLSAQASEVRAGLVACTGNTGCKFAASDTKRHALAIADHVDAALKLDTPINIHLTGCPHSCAQHYIGDLGLLGAKVAVGEEQVEGYHVYAGGGFGERRALAREILRDVPADKIPAVVERLLRAYVERRASADEPFQAFAQRYPPEDLRKMAAA
jgi:ferredoxin-nitrite reductase